eukprot:6250565-Pyramimonas_sp.AAC.1
MSSPSPPLPSASGSTPVPPLVRISHHTVDRLLLSHCSKVGQYENARVVRVRVRVRVRLANTKTQES